MISQPTKASVYIPKSYPIPGMTLWFDATDARTLKMFSNNVGQWFNKGSLVSASLSSSFGISNSPTLSSINGKSILSFSGQARLVQKNYFNIDVSTPSTCHIFIAYHPGTVAVNDITDYYNNSGVFQLAGINRGIYLRAAPFTIFGNIDDSSVRSAVTRTADLARFQTISAFHINRQIGISVNGGVENVANNINDTNSADFDNLNTSLGYTSSDTPNFTIGEIIVYKRALTTFEKQHNINYLRNKWQT